MTNREAEVRRAIAMAADEAARWDTQAAGFVDLTDAGLLAARDELIRLVDQIEALVTIAEAAIPVDEALVGTASRTLRTARHNEVWAGYVLHQRLPQTDLADLS